MYYWLSCNDFSKNYLPFRNFRFCIENILNLNIEFKNYNDIKENDILIVFSYDLYNPTNILNQIINNKYKVLIINTEHYKFKNIIDLYKSIDNKKHILLLEYNFFFFTIISKSFSDFVC